MGECSTPMLEAVEDYNLYGLAYCCGGVFIEVAAKGDVVGGAVEEHHVESAGGGVCAGYRRMAAVIGVQFNIWVVRAKMAPYSSNGA